MESRRCNSHGRVAPPRVQLARSSCTSEAPVAPSGVRVAPRPGATRTFQVASGLSEMCDSHISNVRLAHFRGTTRYLKCASRTSQRDHSLP